MWSVYLDELLKEFSHSCEIYLGYTHGCSASCGVRFSSRALWHYDPSVASNDENRINGVIWSENIITSNSNINGPNMTQITPKITLSTEP